MTQREFLVSTVQFYTSENRSVHSGTNECLYAPTENSPGCAIGRFLNKDLALELDEKDTKGLAVSFVKLNTPDLFEQFPDWMKEMNISFLRKVQLLHDDSENWNENGISDKGKEIVKEIYEYHELEPLTEDEFKRIDN